MEAIAIERNIEWQQREATSTPGSPFVRGLTGLAGVPTRSAKYPRGGDAQRVVVTERPVRIPVLQVPLATLR
jgi:hypothetical protein